MAVTFPGGTATPRPGEDGLRYAAHGEAHHRGAAGGSFQADGGEVILPAAQNQNVGGGVKNGHLLPAGDVAQCCEVG